MKESSIFKARKSMSFRFCIFSKLRRVWWNQQRADWIRMEHIPRIHHVAAPWHSHRSTEQIRRNTKNFHKKKFYLCQFSTTLPVTEKAIKKNVWQMPESSPFLQRDLVLVNGHLLVQVPKRSGILWKRIVHKEFGITSRKRCWWNSLKVDFQFSGQQLHCPGKVSKAKDTENCLYILLRIKRQLRPFSHYCFCKSAQSPRSSRKHVWRMRIPSR